jgi:hypothetical protein
MSIETKAMDILLEKAKVEVHAGIASGYGTKYWNAARDAIGVLERNRGDIETWGVLGFKALLESLSKTPANEQTLIQMMTARQLVLDMRHGAETLREDTARREAIKDKVVQVLLELGSIGAQLLLRVV